MLYEELRGYSSCYIFPPCLPVAFYSYPGPPDYNRRKGLAPNYGVVNMAAIKHNLQRDLFKPSEERLYAVVSVTKAGKKKKASFLCVAGINLARTRSVKS